MVEIAGRKFGVPSSTIQASTIAGTAATVAWEIAAQWGFQARPTLVASSVLLASSLIGYLKKETVLPLNTGS